MKTNLGKLFAALSMLDLLASLSPAAMATQSVDSPGIHVATQDALARHDHEAVAKYYEDIVTQLQAKINGQKELLEQYEKVQLYGWQSHKLKSQTWALIRKYEQAIRSNMKKAATHRQKALASS